MVGVVAEGHRPLLGRSRKDIEEVHRIVRCCRRRSVIALRDEVGIAVLDRHGLVDAAIDRVDVEEPLTLGRAMGRGLCANAEVVDLLIGGGAVADAVVAVWRPARPVATRRDHLAHVDTVRPGEGVGCRDIGHLARCASAPAHLDRHIMGRRVGSGVIRARLCRKDRDLTGDVAELQVAPAGDVDPVAHCREDTISTYERVDRHTVAGGDRHSDVARGQREDHCFAITEVHRVVAIDHGEAAVGPACLLGGDGHGPVGVRERTVRPIPTRCHDSPPSLLGRWLMSHLRGRSGLPWRRRLRHPRRADRAGRALG